MSELNSELDEILARVKDKLYGLIMDGYDVGEIKTGHDDSGKCHPSCKMCPAGGDSKFCLLIELVKRTETN